MTDGRGCRHDLIIIKGWLADAIELLPTERIDWFAPDQAFVSGGIRGHKKVAFTSNQFEYARVDRRADLSSTPFLKQPESLT